MLPKFSEAQVRSALRCLDDPSRLRANPLGAHLMSAGLDVREHLEAAIMQLPSHLRSIVIRCDLTREPRESVAVSLDISERHLYRLRHQALKRLTTLLDAPPEVVPASSVVVDPIDLAICFATAQEHAGDVDGAIESLESLFTQANAVCDRARVVFALSELLFDAQRFAIARTQLDRATALIALADSHDHCRSQIVNDIDLMELRFASLAGGIASAIEKAERLRDRLQTSLNLPTEKSQRRRVAETLISVLLILGALHNKSQAFGLALTVVLEAQSLFRRFGVSNPTLHTRCLTMLAEVQAHTTGRISCAIDQLEAALSLAERYSLPRIAATIASSLGSAHGVRGNKDRAAGLGSAALRLASAACSTREYARIGLELASSHVLAKASRPAKLLLADVAAYISDDDFYLGAVAALTAADINLLDADYDATLVNVHKSKAMIERLGELHLLGSAFRMEAEAHEALGNSNAAKRAVDRALTLLQPPGHPFTLARVYRISGKVKRRRDHRLMADDLIRHLQN